MNIYRLRNFSEYQKHVEQQNLILERRFLELEKLENENRDKDFLVKGFSITAGQEVKFIVDWHYSNGNHINWRERLACPITELNNRQRASYHLYLSELQPYEDDEVYITEQVTPLYSFLKRKIPNLTGSEFVDSEMTPGQVNEAHIRHEDLTKLSFQSNSLDKIISFDCLEHIPEYQLAIKECFRTLKPGGVMLVSFPFNKRTQETLTRATVSSDGVISHLTEPEYHGNPLSDEGCLSYYTFGWDVLDVFRSIGFVDVYAALYWSDIFGYLGDEQIAFVAKK